MAKREPTKLKREPEQRYRLTKTVVAGLPGPADGRDRIYHFDDRTPGFCICVTSAGGRTWYLYRKINKQPVRTKIGRFPEITPEQARTKALKLIGGIADGIDPRRAKRAARDEWTFNELFVHWMTTHAKLHKRTWAEDQRQFDTFLKRWAGRKVSTIKRHDVVALHSKIGETHGHYAANRLLALVRAAFNKGIEAGLSGINPAAKIKKFQEESRARFLSFEEVRPFFQSLAAEHELFQHFFTLALLTGARRANVQAMRWDDLSLAHRLWKIPGEFSKSGEPLVVTLAPEAVDILKAREKNRNGSPYVFASRGRSGHLCEPKTAWKRIIDRAGLTDLRLHDLRRTLGSWQAIAGTSLAIIGQSLGHRSQQSTATYARLSSDAVRDSVDKATTALLTARDTKPKRKKPSKAAAAKE